MLQYLSTYHKAYTAAGLKVHPLDGKGSSNSGNVTNDSNLLSNLFTDKTSGTIIIAVMNKNITIISRKDPLTPALTSTGANI